MLKKKKNKPAAQAADADPSPHSTKWLKMAPNGSKWLELAPNGSNWIQMAPKGFNLL